MNFSQNRHRKEEWHIASDPQPNQKPSSGKEPAVGKKWLWSLLFLAIAGLTVWAVVSQSHNFSFRRFAGYVRRANPWWLLLSVLFMVGFIVFEGIALLCLLRTFRQKKGLKNGFIYSASDLYFSAITPSATGGQPVSAFFMMRDGIPGATTTVVLIANLSMYTLSILVIGAVCFLLRPLVFLRFGIVSKILILVGCVAQIGLGCFFFLLLKKHRWVHIICDRILLFLGKIRLIRHPDRKRDKLVRTMEDYRRCSEMISGQWKMMSKVFFWNFLQRASQIAVTSTVYLATGGELSEWFDVFALQSYVVLGSNCVPIPGAMGVSDYLMLDGFSFTMAEDMAIQLELLSRSISFYSCILICGIAVLVSYLRRKGEMKLENNSNQK